MTPQEWLSTATRTDGGDWLESLTVSTPPRSGYDASRGRDSFTLVDGGAGDSGVRAAHNFGVRRPAASAGTTTAADSVSPFATRSRFPSGRSPTSTPGWPVLPSARPSPIPPRWKGGSGGGGRGKCDPAYPTVYVSHRCLRTLTVRRSGIGTSRCCRPTLTGSPVTTTASDVRHRAALAHEAG